MKRRLLVCGEASWLSTGFATYNREILKRLHSTGKYEIAEMGGYGHTDNPIAKKLPWKFYGVLPNNDSEYNLYKSKPTNQFGEYKFDAVVAEFQPDIIFDPRDPWMFQHIVQSRFRPYYKTVFMPTVDSAPQKREWVDGIFSKTDALLAYSRYGKRVLESEGLRVAGISSPGVDLELFKPLDKKKVRSDWGINKNLLVIGTVMRNQKRKCFPELFEAYAQLRKKHGNIKEIEKSVLMCHTSWPDVGWNIPELLKRNGIPRHVIFTYKCESCTKTFFSWFLPCDQKGMGKCIFCGKISAHMPNTHSGVSNEELVEIYNLMDIYVQPAICEGWGLPIVEAKSCGIPGMYSNYSAMEDHVENGGGLEIKLRTKYTEAETMAIRSLPDVDDMVSKMKMLLTNHKKRKRLSQEARETCEKMHGWDLTAGVIEGVIDSIEIKNRDETWNARPSSRFQESYSQPPFDAPNEQFVLWCYRSILGREPDPSGFNDWMNALNNGKSKEDVLNFFKGEIHAHNKFEEIRWTHSLALRGHNPNQNIVLLSDRLPGDIL